ncbi:hypothetical protein ACFQV8_26240 [Pseudonocardia benzenivorans]
MLETNSPVTGPVALPTVTADDETLRDALTAGNIPTLLLVLRTLTGDPRWFAEPYRPSRTIAMNDNDSGGLPEPVQQEIRDAVLDVLRELRDGGRDVTPPRWEPGSSRSSASRWASRCRPSTRRRWPRTRASSRPTRSTGRRSARTCRS